MRLFIKRKNHLPVMPLGTGGGTRTKRLSLSTACFLPLLTAFILINLHFQHAYEPVDIEISKTSFSHEVVLQYTKGGDGPEGEEYNIQPIVLTETEEEKPDHIVYFHWPGHRWGDFDVSGSRKLTEGQQNVDSRIEWWIVVGWEALDPSFGRCPRMIRKIFTKMQEIAMESPYLSTYYNQSRVQPYFEDWSVYYSIKNYQRCEKFVSSSLGEEKAALLEQLFYTPSSVNRKKAQSLLREIRSQGMTLETMRCSRLLNAALDNTGPFVSQVQKPTTQIKLKLMLQDWSDLGYDRELHTCSARMSKILGKENVYLSSRKLVKDRDLSCFSPRNATCFANTTISSLNGTIRDYQAEPDSISRFIHNGVIAKNDFFVREDYYELLNSRVKQRVHVQGLPTNEHFVSYERNKDVAHFWDTELYDDYGQFRNAVTEHLKEFLAANEFSGTTKLVSNRRHFGRTRTSRIYADAMLDHKIIVLAQRDQWEDHFRLLEGLMSGAMIISDPITFLPAGLKENESIVFYNSLEELDRKLLYYLTNEVGRKERVAIAKEGRRVAVEYHREPDVYRRMMLPGNWPTDWRSPVV